MTGSTVLNIAAFQSYIVLKIGAPKIKVASVEDTDRLTIHFKNVYPALATLRGYCDETGWFPTLWGWADKVFYVTFTKVGNE